MLQKITILCIYLHHKPLELLVLENPDGAFQVSFGSGLFHSVLELFQPLDLILQLLQFSVLGLQVQLEVQGCAWVSRGRGGGALRGHGGVLPSKRPALYGIALESNSARPSVQGH